ncbi:MAG: inositol monophosphatase family protein, partial [Opitutae bacterium]
CAVADNPDFITRIAAAKQAVLGQVALLQQEFGRAKSELKYDGTRVTAVDIAISANIEREILAQFPGDEFFSEETTGSTVVGLKARFAWVIDPIDGTNNYTAGIAYCAISLALLENGRPVYGVIYDLSRHQLVHGGPGYGVWDGAKAAQARTVAPDKLSLIGFHSPMDKAYVQEGKRLIERFKIRGLGSSTLHLTYAAIGILDGVVDHNNRVWDIAAACALCAEAGVEIHYLTDSPFPLREFSAQAPRVQYAAGNPAMVTELRQTLGR